MTEESKVEVELHDEDINDIVEDTLEVPAIQATRRKGTVGPAGPAPPCDGLLPLVPVLAQRSRLLFLRRRL